MAGGITFHDDPATTLPGLQRELKSVIAQLRYGKNLLSDADRKKFDALFSAGIAAPSGGGVVDVQARAAIASILALLGG